MTTEMLQPYSGVKVLDLSQGIAGPYCAEILLQNGADVIKVEPLAGDWCRRLGVGHDQGMTAVSAANNFGKRSICIDTTDEKGRELLCRLVTAADVLIESFRPGVMKRLRLSYDDLKRHNSKLVYVSINGFGPDGPYAGRPATDSFLQALSGLASENCNERGLPRKVGLVPLIDAVTGVYAAQATGAALFLCATKGEGRHVQISLLESAAAVQATSIIRSKVGETPSAIPKGIFATADGYINIYTVHDKMFGGLCRALKRETWQHDSRYATMDARSRRAAEITEELAAIFRTNSAAHWLKVLEAEDVICARVNDYHGFLEDVQVRHAKLFHYVVQPPFGILPASRVPGADPDVPLQPAPRAGAHTREILKELGLDSAEIDQLCQSGVTRAETESR